MDAPGLVIFSEVYEMFTHMLSSCTAIMTQTNVNVGRDLVVNFVGDGWVVVIVVVAVVAFTVGRFSK